MQYTSHVCVYMCRADIKTPTCYLSMRRARYDSVLYTYSDTCWSVSVSGIVGVCIMIRVMSLLSVAVCMYAAYLQLGGSEH